jgi:hypothetical protein
MSVISENTICGVLKDNKLVWNCNGLETKTSKQEKLTGTILRCNENLIVSRILKILLNEKELIDWE